MPKVIENVRGQLLTEARKQISEQGYAKTTIRSIANGCKIAVGTVYNYFPSKEMLIASFVADDWYRCMKPFHETPPRDAEDVLHRIFDMLRDFSAGHRALFTDPDAEKAFSAIFSTRHRQLRDQLAALILPFCTDDASPSFLSSFLAESVLTWTMAGEPFDRIFSVLGKLLPKQVIKNENIKETKS